MCLSIAVFRFRTRSEKNWPTHVLWLCRNRCFRCLFSSKAPSGGSPPAGSPFQLSGRYPPIGWTLPLPHQWLSSLVCHTPPSATLLQFSARELSAVSNLLIAKPTMLPPPGRAPMSGPASGRQQGYAAPFTVRLLPLRCCVHLCALLVGLVRQYRRE